MAVPPQHTGRGQHLWLWSRSAHSECAHSSVTQRKMQGGMVRLQLSLGHFTHSLREALARSLPLWWVEKRMWQWVHSCPWAEQLVLGLQVCCWDVVALVPLCPHRATRATKLCLLSTLPWEEHRAIERTGEDSGERMTYTLELGIPGGSLDFTWYSKIETVVEAENRTWVPLGDS